MKKAFFWVVLIVCAFTAAWALAEEQASEAPAAQTSSETPAPAPAPEPAPVAVPEAAAPTTAPAPAPATNEEMQVSENLVFSSGEVVSVDDAAKSLTVKVYGESDNPATEKTVTVHVDGNTDITDGEKDRQLNSLAPQTEVDVEYDPATNKATYIFVY